jgi:acetyl esterase/lipase
VAALAPPEGAAEAVAAARGAARPDRRWFVLGGRYDRLLPDAQRLADRLREAREPVTYLEVPEGHSRETFRGHLDDALRWLLDARR